MSIVLTEKQKRLLDSFASIQPLLASIESWMEQIKDRDKRSTQLPKQKTLARAQRDTLQRLHGRYEALKAKVRKTQKADRVLARKMEAFEARDRADSVATDNLLDRILETTDRLHADLDSVLADQRALIGALDQFLAAT